MSKKGASTEMSSVLSVSDFSATGDGTTDDTANVLAAFAAAAGKTLVFETGKTYLVKNEIIISAYTTVNLQGATIRFEQIGQKYLFKLSSNVSIANGTIQNNSKKKASPNDPDIPIEGYLQTILGVDVKNITIRNIEFQNKEQLATSAIALYGDVNNVLVENIHGGQPKGFEPLNQIFISHWWWNEVEFNPNEIAHDTGRTSNHPRNIVIRNVTAKGRIKTAIWLSSSYNCKLQNIAFEAERGITIYPGDYGQDFAEPRFFGKINRNIEIENVMITNCSGTGIYLTATGKTAKPVAGNIAIRDFTVVASSDLKSGFGVFASGATNVQIHNGTITSFQFGIALGDETYGAAIENVTINSCKDRGISVDSKTGPSRSISIENCKIYNNNLANGGVGNNLKTSSGIYLNNCADVKISNNSFGQISGGEKQYASIYSTNSPKDLLYFSNNHTFSARQSNFYIQDP